MLHPSRMFQERLAGAGANLAFTTYQAGKVFFNGYDAEAGKLSIFERCFLHCIGLDDGDGRLWSEA